MLRGVYMIKATATDNTSQLQAERVINSFCFDDVSYQFIDWLYRLHIYCIYIYKYYTHFLIDFRAASAVLFVLGGDVN